MRDAQAAWLAGLWDGEGSIGVVRSMATGRLTLIPQIQIHMTDLPTMDRVVDLFALLGVTARYHRGAEKQAHHRDSYHLSVRRTSWVLATAEALAPHSVTKARQWALMHELCELRIARQGVADSGGCLKRGGAPGWAQDYASRELEVAHLLASLNRRPTPEENPHVAVA